MTLKIMTSLSPSIPERWRLVGCFEINPLIYTLRCTNQKLMSLPLFFTVSDEIGLSAHSPNSVFFLWLYLNQHKFTQCINCNFEDNYACSGKIHQLFPPMNIERCYKSHPTCTIHKGGLPPFYVCIKYWNHWNVPRTTKLYKQMIYFIVFRLIHQRYAIGLR